MKKLFVLIAALVVFAGQAFAAPVDVNTAKELGAKYLKNNVVSAKGITDVQHVYTLSNEEGVAYLYVFNYDNGFVVMAADDRAYPVLGYGEDDIFDINAIPDGMRYYLGHYGREIQYAIDNELVAEPDVVEQWDLLRKEGVIMKTRMNKAVQPLLATTWDQGWPYNYYAPACTSYWTNNHCYAGCVATAMSQCMKFWNWPETGVGEHSYNTSSYPGNGATLSANFGATTYEWSIMPNSVSSANAGGLAVALLMYHCGIAVNMNYSPDGSGAQTGDAVDALIEHFRYGSCTNLKYRDDFSLTEWEDMLIESFDHGIPTIYAGQGNDGGHAFNCDGYNDQRKFHFNWGWSGQYNNTYYSIDALNTGNGSFNTYQRVILNMIPDYIYDVMVPAITTMTAAPEDAITKTVVVSFTLPTQSMSGAALASAEQVVLKRDGVTIHTFTNVQAGDVMTYEDAVAEYGAYEYTIVGYNDNLAGEDFSQIAIVGPNCTWKLVGTTTNFQGWNGGALQFIGANGVVFKTVTMANSTPLSLKFQMPEGDFTVNWVAPSSTVQTMTFTLKNSANESVCTFSGSSTQISSTVYNGNNDCPSCTAPTGFAGECVFQGGVSGTLLSWECDYAPSKFKVYRSADGEEYSEIASVNGDVHEYFDGVGTVDTYYYKVTAFSSACESNPALTPDNTDYVIVMVTSVAENSTNARLYPNPTNGNLRIEAEALNCIAVYNLVGQKVYEENIDGDECVVNMKEFGSGVYMVKIQTATGSTTQKVSVIE
ncbi:MAG: thiol protease/hemagglutinin PrtT [Bacteroidales bacterium]|nr:thiol protease/hemagglutinin PrtT [Bacteroidales bacterium]